MISQFPSKISPFSPTILIETIVILRLDYFLKAVTMQSYWVLHSSQPSLESLIQNNQELASLKVHILSLVAQ